jgi:hypothetical protein
MQGAQNSHKGCRDVRRCLDFVERITGDGVPGSLRVAGLGLSFERDHRRSEVPVRGVKFRLFREVGDRAVEEDGADLIDLFHFVSLVVLKDFTEFDSMIERSAGGAEFEFFAVEREAVGVKFDLAFALFEFAVFKNPAGKRFEGVELAARAGGDFESPVGDEGLRGAVHDLRGIGQRGAARRSRGGRATQGEEAGEVEVFGAVLGAMAGGEAAQGGFMGFQAETVGWLLGDDFNDLAGGMEFEPAEEAFAVIGGEFIEDGNWCSHRSERLEVKGECVFRSEKICVCLVCFSRISEGISVFLSVYRNVFFRVCGGCFAVCGMFTTGAESTETSRVRRFKAEGRSREERMPSQMRNATW